MPGKLQKRIHRKDSVAGFGSIVVRRKPPMRLEKRHTERRDIWLGWVYVRVGPAWVYRRRRWRYRSKRRFACVYSFVRVRSSESSVQNGDGQRRHIRIRNQPLTEALLVCQVLTFWSCNCYTTKYFTSI